MDPEKYQLKEQLDLRALDTSTITDRLKKYNDQFSVYRTAARQMMDAWENEDRNPDEPSVTENQKAEELITFEDMKVEFAPLLQAIGLELQPVRAGSFVASSEGVHFGTQMRLNLKEGKQFVTYLKSLGQDTASLSQKESLKEIADVLLTQFKTSYDLNNPEDERLLEFMGSLSSIIAEYKRLDNKEPKTFTEKIDELEKYLAYAKRGCLREYREAEELRLNKPFSREGFILRWHIDASPDSLEKEWNSLLAALHRISQNEKAKDIYAQARETANTALQAALKEVGAWPLKTKGYEAKKDQFLAILRSVESRLQEF